MYNEVMLNIINRVRSDDLKAYFPLLEEYYARTLKTLKLKDNYVVSVIICGPKTIRKINREYRQIDKETDVISFALLDDDEEMYFDDTVELGDIFINRSRVLSQAEEYGHSIKRELVFLFVHGLLHLFGYDHMEKEDEKKMIALQKKIVGDLS